jgi:hypothetical protein
MAIALDVADCKPVALNVNENTHPIPKDVAEDIIARIARLKGPIIALSLVSGVLFLSTLGAWIYQGYSSF